MDEYVGIDPDHKASFPRFLRKHLIDHITPLSFYPLSSEPTDVDRICSEYAALLKAYPADMVALGRGEMAILPSMIPLMLDLMIRCGSKLSPLRTPVGCSKSERVILPRWMTYQPMPSH